MRVLRSTLLILALTSSGLVSVGLSSPAQAVVSPAETRTVTLEGTFKTTNQSLWGAGDAAAPGTQSMSLFDESWNESEGGDRKSVV